jgi:hypothetical protein
MLRMHAGGYQPDVVIARRVRRSAVRARCVPVRQVVHLLEFFHHLTPPS